MVCLKRQNSPAHRYYNSARTPSAPGSYNLYGIKRPLPLAKWPMSFFPRFKRWTRLRSVPLASAANESKMCSPVSKIVMIYRVSSQKNLSHHFLTSIEHQKDIQVNENVYDHIYERTSRKLESLSNRTKIVGHRLYGNGGYFFFRHRTKFYTILLSVGFNAPSLCIALFRIRIESVYL